MKAGVSRLCNGKDRLGGTLSNLESLRHGYVLDEKLLLKRR